MTDHGSPEGVPMLDATLDIRAVVTLLTAVQFHLDRWPGGHPQEQANLMEMRDFLFRMQLELTVGPEG